MKHFTDDHPAAPTFTPPELPKRVHVRGATGNQICDKISLNQLHIETEKKSLSFDHERTSVLILDLFPPSFDFRYNIKFLVLCFGFFSKNKNKNKT